MRLFVGASLTQRSAHEQELAVVVSKLKDAERDASKFKGNAIQADDESDSLRDKLSKAEQSIQGLRADVIQKKALAEGFEQQLQRIQGIISMAEPAAAARSQTSRAPSAGPNSHSISSQQGVKKP